MTSLPIRKSTGRFGRTCLILALLAVSGAGAAALKAQQGAESGYTGISVEASPQIFSTMCALDAAGFGADESTLAQMPARLALRGELLKMQGTATDALRQFYQDHALADPGETLSRYITFALVIGPPPQFQFQGNRDTLPPDVLALDGLQELLANFYREARLDIRWAKIEPEYEPAVERYRASLRKIVTVSDAYLREVLKPSTGRTFTVYVEPLVGTRSNFRNYGDQYSIVVGASPEMPVDAMQHAYLHFMLDPIVLHYRPLVEQKRALLEVAARAPRLPEEYQNDFVSFTDECFIKAVELRLRHLRPQELEAALQDADQSGFILVRPFVRGLQGFEKAEPAMTYYFPDLIVGIDVDAERKRMQGFTFAAAQHGPATDEHNTLRSNQTSEIDQWLAQGDREIAQKDAPAATATFEKAFAKYPDDPRALYGLAIASVLSGKGDRAKELFQRVVSAPNSAPPSMDPAVLSWSHVYLGRIHDLEGDRDLAVNEYRAAMAVDGAPESAHAAAQSGVEAAYKTPRSDESTQPQP
ncbi:MAG: tetratricopeptide repeat protein [Candidatus Acidiferrales bacterium]